MMLVGDIGGTKTHLALFEKKELLNLQTFHSANYHDLESIIKEYLSRGKYGSIETASFAIAGPVQNGVCRTTNLPWIVDAKKLAKDLNFKSAYLLNDLEANAYAIAVLPESSFLELYRPKKEMHGNRAVLSPGTGLGEAGLFWDGKKHHPFACEGGHCDYAPRSDIEIELLQFLIKKYGHVSYERILSGMGFHNIFDFLTTVKKRSYPDGLEAEIKKGDPAKVISEHGLDNSIAVCIETLDLFVSILGAEAGNLALKFMAFGGIYLGGGIPPKILEKIKSPLFLSGYFNKGRMLHLIENMPIRLILDDKAALKGV